MYYRLFHVFIVFCIFCILTIGATGTAAVYERAGWQAPLSTLFHDVSGTVTIVDANTLLVGNFNYDGTAPAVYLYLAEENTNPSIQNGLATVYFPTGTVHTNETFYVDLPGTETLDGYNAVSVWCQEFHVNFGSGLFGSVVQYEVTFDAAWSMATHTNFPANAHFSDLVGGTHDGSVTFWQVGGSASAGMEEMAELGGTSTLSSEVNAKITTGQAYNVILGGGINPSPGSVSQTFEMHSAHPLVTLVSMIAPSPDWFVGVSDLPLFENGQWLSEVVVDLWPYDAGTDSGTDFTSANADTNPADPIALITGYPFENDPPLGTFTFQLVCPNPPAGDVNGDCRVDLADFAQFAGNWMLDCTLTPMHPECL
jgi:hypothetical protein